MAKQSQPGGGNNASTSLLPSSSAVPRIRPVIATQGGSVLQSGDEGVKQEVEIAKQEAEIAKREAERQALFQNESNNNLNIPNGYLKVAVLILRWDESIDEFEGHTTEIERLQDIFTTGFGYTCRVARIKNTKNPQISLNYEIIRHLEEYSGPDNLVIIYYTGHGSLVGDDQRLELSATKNGTEKSGRYIPTAYWDQAEEPLRTLAECDALSILDCCFASNAALKSRGEELRTYQLLAACPPGSETKGPGENSFTKALSDSLEELLKQSKGANFPVTKLWERINTKRTTQASLIWDRLHRYKRSVQLGQLNPTQERDASFHNAKPEISSLTLRFSLKVGDLTKKQIVSLAQRLPVACKDADLPIRRIDWVKMEVTPLDPMSFSEAANRVHMVISAKKAMRRKSDAKKMEAEKSKVEKQGKHRGKKRKSTNGTPVSPSKRSIHESPSISESMSSPASGLRTESPSSHYSFSE